MAPAAVVRILPARVYVLEVMDGSGSRFRYWPALDGVRAVAVLAVLGLHSRLPIARGGALGVDIFLVLSGFLITTILLAERDARGRFSFANFYARRVLRLYPALLTVTAAAIVLGVLVNHEPLAAQAWRGLTADLYLSDWSMAFGFGPTSGNLWNLAHTWSLAIEEQFYLIWPCLLAVLLAVFKSRRQLAAFLLIAAALVAIHRTMVLRGNPADFPRVEYALDTRADALLIGCALGLLLSTRPNLRDTRLVRIVGATCGLLVMLAIVLVPSSYSPALFAGGLSLFALAVAAFIGQLIIAPIRSVEALLSWRPIVHVGRISYGLYLWHFPVFAAIRTQTSYSPTGNGVIEIARYAVTFAMAELSFHFVERRFLRLKARFAYIRTSPEEVQGAAEEQAAPGRD